MKKKHKRYKVGSNMKGPFALTKTNIEKRTLKSGGVYFLADHSKTTSPKKVVKYVGRATSLTNRLSNHLGNYDCFYYIKRVTEHGQFSKECREFHRYGKANNLNNKIHPARPERSGFPSCTEWGCKGEAK